MILTFVTKPTIYNYETINQRNIDFYPRNDEILFYQRTTRMSYFFYRSHIF